MANYLLIESRDPYEYGDPEYFYQLAQDLATNGNQVTFFLIQNGVLVARNGAQGAPVQQLAAAPNISVLADDFSLRERAIAAHRVAAGVSISNVDALVDLLMADSVKAVWH